MEFLVSFRNYYGIGHRLGGLAVGADELGRCRLVVALIPRISLAILAKSLISAPDFSSNKDTGLGTALALVLGIFVVQAALIGLGSWTINLPEARSGPDIPPIGWLTITEQPA